MTRPFSVTIASWIWLLCGLFTTVIIANVLSTTVLAAFATGAGVDQDNVGTVDVIGWSGWLITVGLIAAMVLQVVSAVKLRDGERWARELLSVTAAFSLVVVLYDITLWSAWLLFAANAVAMVLAHSDTASDYLELRPLRLVSV